MRRGIVLAMLLAACDRTPIDHPEPEDAGHLVPDAGQTDVPPLVQFPELPFHLQEACWQQETVDDPPQPRPWDLDLYELDAGSPCALGGRAATGWVSMVFDRADSGVPDPGAYPLDLPDGGLPGVELLSVAWQCQFLDHVGGEVRFDVTSVDRAAGHLRVLVALPDGGRAQLQTDFNARACP